MGFAGQPTQTTSAATGVEPMVVPQAQPTVVNKQQPGTCDCCSVPSNTSQAVKATRWSSIAIIATHAIALVAFGFYIWEQWIASLMGIIMGGILLCVFNKCCYITASVLYSVAAVFDIITAIFWLAYGSILALFPLLGFAASLVGAIAAGMATCNWDDSWTADVKAPSGPVQVAHPSAVPSIHTATVQPNYIHPAASRGPPPSYVHGV